MYGLNKIRFLSVGVNPGNTYERGTAIIKISGSNAPIGSVNVHFAGRFGYDNVMYWIGDDGGTLKVFANFAFNSSYWLNGTCTYMSNSLA